MTTGCHTWEWETHQIHFDIPRDPRSDTSLHFSDVFFRRMQNSFDLVALQVISVEIAMITAGEVLTAIHNAIGIEESKMGRLSTLIPASNSISYYQASILLINVPTCDSSSPPSSSPPPSSPQAQLTSTKK